MLVKVNYYLKSRFTVKLHLDVIWGLSCGVFCVFTPNYRKYLVCLILIGCLSYLIITLKSLHFTTVSIIQNCILRKKRVEEKCKFYFKIPGGLYNYAKSTIEKNLKISIFSNLRISIF